jgi:hypothetical protein
MAALAVARPGPAVAMETGFEQRLVARVMKARELVRDEAPEGKRIDRIVVVNVPVFTPADPIPDAFNILHLVTREHVVRRELLVEEGGVWDKDRVEESARNLRLMLILSVAVIVPFRVEGEGGVGLLVVTKDVWSLRLGFAELLILDETVRFRGALTEMNLLGLDKQIALKFGHDPWINEVGQSYFDRRVLGSRWTFFESVDAIIDEDEGQTLRGNYLLVRPFWSLATRWAGQVSFFHDAGVTRAQSGNDVAVIELEPGTFVRRQWRRRTLTGSALLAHQVGDEVKHRFALGIATSDFQLEAPDEVPKHLQGRFFDVLRLQSERANKLTASWSLNSTDYRKMRDVHHYSLTEDFVAGPSLHADAGWSAKALGSDESFLTGSVGAGWRFIEGTRYFVSTGIDVSARRTSSGELIDRSIDVSVLSVSPQSRHGRLIWRGVVNRRSKNQHLGVLTLGGDGGLRGYPIGLLRGDSAWISNTEWRSRSWRWMTYHFGYVVFWDAAATWDEDAPPKPLHGVGAGLRLFIPQSNRRVLRLDFAGPVDDFLSGRLVFAFNQAF